MQNSSDNDIIEAGIDEAGRGCMSGRVYTACVILPNTYPDDTYLQIIDSKKISAKKRTILKKYIEDVALAYSVEYADIEEIESKNILHATIAAMHRAIDKIEIKPENILVDGNYFRIYKDSEGEIIPHQTIKGGDNKYRNIAAASILAKTNHDEYVLDLLDKYPELEKYGWRKNMCYGTKQHMDAIKAYGTSKFHRKSFGICKNY
tara:strand:+ start:4444 stop:5058 length:615 start_codon:yes stop_codon:yes gene_type:complete